MKISVVIPLYNKAAQVRATLESVRLQTFTDYELLIVDDGSTDGSPDVVCSYLKEHKVLSERVQLFRQDHAGVSAARNRGIRESRFEWIAFLDADDTWSPEYLQAQYRLSQKYPFCEVLAAGYGFCPGGGKYMAARFSKLPFRGQDGVLDNYFEVAACSHPPLSSLTTIVRKEAMVMVGGFPEGVFSGEDLLAWARLAVVCRIAFSRKNMGLYDQDPSHRNADQRARMPAAVDLVGSSLEEILRKHHDVPGLKEYVGVWFKMRTRIYLTHSMRREAWVEWKKLVRFKPRHYKTWAYLLVFFSPLKTFQ